MGRPEKDIEAALSELAAVTLRLEKAQVLLQQTQMRVIDIATACGFSTQSLFSKRYKRHFGISTCDEKALLAH